MEKLVIGLDIGGTTVKIGFLTSDGKILKKTEIPTNKEENGKYIVKEVWNKILLTLDSMNMDCKDILSITAGAPGFINRRSKNIYEAINIGWKNYHLGDELEALANVPVFIENDANLAALGENWKGAGTEAENMIHVTLGTGVGGGIILNGEIVSGVNGTAGEIGHITVEKNGSLCNCGRFGCLETVASATGIVRQAHEIIKGNRSTELFRLINVRGNITAKDIFNLADQGEPLSKQIIKKSASTLGFALANLSVALNPSIITIGGGLSKAGEGLIYAIEKSFRVHALPRISNSCEIKVAKLGNDAGIIGAVRASQLYLGMEK